MADARKLTEVFRALCVNALAARLEVTAAVSRHLRVLRHAKLVIPDKRGVALSDHCRLGEFGIDNAA